MGWLRKVRKARIPQENRDLFERYGESIIVGLLISGLQPPYVELQRIYNNKDAMQNARDWLTERGDIRERREQRLEIVEWAILIFVVLGVIVESISLFHEVADHF